MFQKKKISKNPKKVVKLSEDEHAKRVLEFADNFYKKYKTTLSELAYK